MKKSDLKVGYVAKLRKGTLCMVLPNANDEMCLSGERDWFPVSELRDDLTDKYTDTADVVEVYGRCAANKYAHDLRTHRRDLLWKRCDLLWKRSEAKKMTVKEICDALGYEVEIVKDGADE